MSKPSQDVWNVDETDFPENGTSEEKARFLIRYAILARSVHDAQPWSFQVSDNTIKISVREEPRSSEPPLTQRERFVSIGCALENLCLAAQRFEVPHRMKYEPRGPSTFVSVHLNPGGSSTTGRAELFDRITEQRTYDGAFLDQDLPREFLKTVENVDCDDVVVLRLITENEEKKDLDQLQAESEANRGERRTAMNGSGNDTGILSWISNLLRSVLPFAGRDHDRTNDDDRNIYPPAIVLSGWTDGPVCWIKTGRVFQRIDLISGREEVSVRPVYAVVSNPETRKALDGMVDPEEVVPQLLLRLGYGTTTGEQTPRWPVQDVLADR